MTHTPEGQRVGIGPLEVSVRATEAAEGKGPSQTVPPPGLWAARIYELISDFEPITLADTQPAATSDR